MESRIIPEMQTTSSNSTILSVLGNLVSNFGILMINILTGLITARILSSNGRGELSAMSMWAQFIAYCMTLALPSALLYNIRVRRQDASKLLSASLMLGLILGLMSTVLGVLVIPFIIHQYPVDVIRFAQWSMVISPLCLTSLICASLMQALGDFRNLNRSKYLGPVLTLVALLALLITHKMTAKSAALAYILGAIPVNIWSLVWSFKQYKPNISGFVQMSRRLLRYGTRLYVGDLLGTLSSQIDRAMVVAFLGASDMGLYVVASSLAGVLASIPNAVTAVLFPKSVALPVDRVVQSVGRALRLSVVLLFISTIGIGLVGPSILALLYGNSFATAAIVLNFLLVEALLSGCVKVLLQTFMATARPGIVSILQGVGVSSSIPLLILLVPRFGLDGAGMGLLLATLLRLMFIVLCYPIVLRCRPPSPILTISDVHTIRRFIVSARRKATPP